MGGPPARASRILQAGLPLPAVFHAMISYMLENKRSAPGYILVKIVRDEVEDLHGERVLTYWGSWENLTADLLDEMAGQGIMTGQDGDIWVLADRVREGSRIRPMTDTRITVWSRTALAQREALTYARFRAEAYQEFLEEKKIFSGEVQETFLRHLESLTWSEETPPETRRYGEIAEFAREYLKSQYPRWVTAKEAAEAYNKMNPQQKPVSPSSAWNRLQQLVYKKQAERTDGKAPGPGRNFTLFRWIGLIE